MVYTPEFEQVNSELDTRWATFIQTKVNSFTKWDLVQFFNNQPHTRDTAENIASFIGKDVNAVRSCLRDLALGGIVEMETVQSEVIFRLSHRAETRETISDFIAACHNPQFRYRAIQTVVETKQRLKHN